MKDSLFAFLGLALAAGVLLIAVLVPPAFETERLKESRDVVTEVERARRLLKKFDVAVNLESDYRDVIGEQQFATLPEDINALLQDPPATFDVDARAQEEFDEYANYPEVKTLPEAEAELLQLEYGGEKWSEHSTPQAPMRMGSGSINQARQAYSQHLSQNAKILDEALRHLNNALAVSNRDPIANRLKGIVLFQQGLNGSRKVALIRARLAEQRANIREWRVELAGVRQDTELVETSEIQERIRRAEDVHKEQLAAIEKQQAQVAELEEQVNDYERRVESAVARSDAAREAMETLQDLGVDLSNPNGFDEFRNAFIQQSNNYRAAVLEAYVAEHGTLDNATIDFTGDYVSGQYEPIIAEQGIKRRRGLVHYRQDLESVRLELEKMLGTASRLEENMNEFKNLRNNFEQRASNAASFVRAQEEQIAEAFDAFQIRYDSLRQEADDTLALFEQAGAAFQLAFGGVSDEERAARDEKPADPARAEFHYSSVAENQDKVLGQITAHHADCYIRRSLIFIGRHLDATGNIEDLGALAGAPDAASEWVEIARDAKDHAVEEVDTAIGLLEKAKQLFGEGNWIVAAQIGTAHYLKAIVGVPLEAEKALEWYKIAVENREDIAPEHVAMRDFIATRLQP